MTPDTDAAMEFERLVGALANISYRLGWLSSASANKTRAERDAAIATLLGHDAAQRGEIAALRAEIERLSKLVYVPGLWHCPKCKLSLIQSNLNASDGTVTARDEPGDKCPNCGTGLWRTTERQAGNDMVDRTEEQLARALAAEAEVERLSRALAKARVPEEVRRDSVIITLREAYNVLAFCFTRLHGSARTRDGELCGDIGKVRSRIEKSIKELTQ